MDTGAWQIHGVTESDTTEHYPHMEKRGITDFPDKWIPDISGSKSPSDTQGKKHDLQRINTAWCTVLIKARSLTQTYLKKIKY